MARLMKLMSHKEKRQVRSWPVAVAVAAAFWVFLFAGCTAPIAANRTTLRQAHKQISASALDGRLSDPAQLVLYRFDLEKSFAKEPAETLRLLHERACRDDRRDLLYALAELNYYHAERLLRSVKPGVPRMAPDYYLSAAIYAWLYLLGEGPEPPPNAFEWRFRVACDLYNSALGRAFMYHPGTNDSVHLASGQRTLPPGLVEVTFSQPGFKWSLADIDRFLPANEFTVRGLAVRDRQSGLGTPLIVVGKTLDAKRQPRRFPRNPVPARAR